MKHLVNIFSKYELQYSNWFLIFSNKNKQLESESSINNHIKLENDIYGTKKTRIAHVFSLFDGLYLVFFFCILGELM